MRLASIAETRSKSRMVSVAPPSRLDSSDRSVLNTDRTVFMGIDNASDGAGRDLMADLRMATTSVARQAALELAVESTSYDAATLRERLAVRTGGRTISNAQRHADELVKAGLLKVVSARPRQYTLSEPGRAVAVKLGLTDALDARTGTYIVFTSSAPGADGARVAEILAKAGSWSADVIGDFEHAAVFRAASAATMRELKAALRSVGARPKVAVVVEEHLPSGSRQ